ncbi:hypothetical protein [Pseudoscardovia suis]|uniref:Uncharacterized protein n=1 Tax=Pseudoscardovia suis TaxID=987063 RepID=A0A261EPQ3_9BIFI|nr:hypothetical protein [Pseudoscardovia suis]OZG48838.1 hypothetical protein PSSU_1662 [Pseudoscardovia suis]PJJ63982.1 hypothetical protein CLV65_1606 [Pseudoscardovia suis]
MGESTELQGLGVDTHGQRLGDIVNIVILDRFDLPIPNGLLDRVMEYATEIVAEWVAAHKVVDWSLIPDWVIVGAYAAAITRCCGLSVARRSLSGI